MEHPDLWSIAVEALEEQERPEVRAWLAGVVIQPGQTERLNTNSTCGDFLQRLFGQEGRSDKADDPATLTESRKTCGENGSATLDSLIGGK